MDIYSKKGTKVICVNKSMDAAKWGANDSPECLLIGGVYSVDHTEVHSYHTKVYLKEFSGKKFSSIHFENIKGGKNVN